MTSPVTTSSIPTMTATTAANATVTPPDQSQANDIGVRNLVEEVDAMLKIKSSVEREILATNAHIIESKFYLFIYLIYRNKN